MIVNTIGGNIGTKLPSLTTPASADKILKGYEVIDQGGNVITGTVETVALTNPTFQFDDVLGKVTASVTAGPGYLDSANTVTDTFDVPITSIATPSVAIDANGLVTATIVQSKGYIGATGTTSATMQLQVRTDDDLTVDSNGVVTAPAGYYPQAAVITASPSAPTISVSSGGLVTAGVGSKQSTHQITSADIPTLTPGNILSGVSIAGVTGNVQGGIRTTVTVSTGVSGAVVTAQCGSSKYTAKCNSSGVATFNLTKAGTWSFSASHDTSGAYSTNNANVVVLDNFPIQLTVGSSTTVSVTGQYTATLNMVRAPKLIGDYGYNSGLGGIGWPFAALAGSGDSSLPGVTSYVMMGGKDTKHNMPRCDVYGTNTDGVANTFSGIVYKYYPSRYSQGSETSSIEHRGYGGYQPSRWGGASASIRTCNRYVSIFAGGYSTCPYDGGYMKNVDAHINTSSSYFGICSADYYKNDSINDPNFQKLNMSVGRAWLAAAGYQSITYALIAGGQTNDNGGVSAVVDYVSITNIIDNENSCTVAKGTCSNLSVARSHLAGIGHVNDYVLFAGGKNSSNSPVATVDAYSNTRTKSSPTSLSVARYNLAAAISSGTFVLFAGGISGNGVSAVIDAYNLSRTRTTPTTLSVARHDLAGLTVGDYAVFAGGRTSVSSGASNVVDMIGPNMVRVTANMEYAKYGCRGCGAVYEYGNIYVGYIFGGLSASDGNAGIYERIELAIT